MNPIPHLVVIAHPLPKTWTGTRSASSHAGALQIFRGQKVPEESDVPALSCVTLTDGWFWKQADTSGHLKPVETAVSEWLIPLNRRHCHLILNAPPNREGRLSPNVVSRLQEIGKAWKHAGPMEKLSEHVVITTPNLAKGKPIHASSYPDTVGPDEANDGDFRTSWYPDEGQSSGWLEVDLKKLENFNVVSMIEPVGRWNDYNESRIRSYRFQCCAPHRGKSGSNSKAAQLCRTSLKWAYMTSRFKQRVRD